MKILVCALLMALPLPLLAQKNVSFKSRVDGLAKGVEEKVVGWRRDFHQHPELGNREFRTAEKIAAHLKALGL